MKRGLLGFPLLVLLMQVVSAQFFGGYGRFSITDFFSSIDSQTMILSLLFFIFFVLIYYVLSRVFKNSYGQPNKGVAGTISLAVSMLIVYGIYQSGFNLGDLFYGLGIGAEILYLISSIIFIILVIFLIKKIGFRGFLIVFGLLLILLTIFTDIFYEKGLVFLIGFILLIIGLLLWRRSRKIMGGIGRGAWGATKGIGKGVGATGRGAWKAGKWVGSKYDWKKEKRQARAIGRGAWGATKGIGKGIAEGGRKTKKIAQREWQKEKDAMQERGIRMEERKLRRAQKAAYKEEARRQRRQQAQAQIQQTNNEIARLRQMIPSASVIERGKIENQIRALEKRAKKLR